MSERLIAFYDDTDLCLPGGAELNRVAFSARSRLALNQWALNGEWTVGREAAVIRGFARRIAYRFHAGDLHLVMGPSRRERNIRFRVSIDGQPPGPSHDADVDGGGSGTVVEQRLYRLIRQSNPSAERRFDIAFFDAGVDTFAFTFG